jgi:hypothetical protein
MKVLNSLLLVNGEPTMKPPAAATQTLRKEQ